MRPTFVIVAVLAAASGAHASWFGSGDAPAPYQSWSSSELKDWLKAHNVDVPKTSTSTDDLRDLVAIHYSSFSAWTQDQYDSAQKSFSNVKESTFDSWDESRLREFLLEQGVVAPKGPKEQLVLLAKQKYRAYNSAASTLSSTASKAASSASKSASTAVYGDTKHQASKSVSSLASTISTSVTSAIAQATKEVTRTADDTKDYVYSTWDDNQLRSYLEQKGAIKTKSEKRRDELLSTMRDYYTSATDPVWKAWSDSYTREWLIDHGIVPPDPSTSQVLANKMSQYYYSTNDAVYNTWSESEMRDWLIKHEVIKSDAQVQKEKLQKLVADNYASAHDTVWGAWSDSQMRQWLIDNGYMKSDAQAKRDELINTISSKYNAASASANAYLTWPDARLRAYLRERGVSEAALPTSRPGLLQETRIRWVQSTNKAEELLARVRKIVGDGVGAAEDAIGQVWEAVSGHTGEGVVKGGEKVKQQGKKLSGEL